MTQRWLRVAPPLAALVYPAFVASGPGIWSPLLALSLVSPTIALVASLYLADREASAARVVALFAIGAPALYSLLGGLLDWQHAIPLTSVRVWIPLWLVLAAIAWRGSARRPVVDSPRHRPDRLVLVHAVAALPIIAFALVHLVNHVGGIAGGDVHVAVMTVLRRVYRHPSIEPVLLGCVAVQVVTGIVLVARRLARTSTAIETLQSAAGAYLVLFSASHVTAALRARARGVDPDWKWLTSSDLFHDPWSARLVPYYVLGVLAIAVHLACALRAVALGHGVRAHSLRWLVPGAAGLAVIAAAVIMRALGS
jgi:hypothetical protein